MIDVVYCLGKGSKYKNAELRYSLRSVEKYLSGIGSVWIVGVLPKWAKVDNFIEMPDPYQYPPDRNIMEKLQVVCEHSVLSENFLFINDDHYLLQPFEADKFPYYQQDHLIDQVKRRGMDGYGRRADNTHKWLVSQGKNTKNFDIHTPILYNKKAFLVEVCGAPWHKAHDGFVIKSLYANSMMIEGEPMKDGKLNTIPGTDVKIFSTYPHVKASIFRFLKEQFPEKSKYEASDF